ncbi:hypothetical protein [Algoriphagus sp. A40]|uniref:hypothetical protein n=1 Tax=Algoriphagus sp. A40 TaxID=1945863 RepID=UPI00111589B2|nr:hypothetical protein [Algoriphagus sp. A40]
MNNSTVKLLLLCLWLFSAASAEATDFETSSFRLSIDSRGMVTGLFDKTGQKDYFQSGASSPLLSIRIGGKFYSPQEMTKSGDSWVLGYPEAQAEVKVKIQNKKSYLTFEILSLKSAQPIELAVWGPYATSIREIIGESVGVVRNSSFALGIQALNVKTLGGFPSEENDIEINFNVVEQGDQIDDQYRWRNTKNYRGQTARIIEGGSILQAYTRDRSQERIISNWSHDKYVAPAFKDGGIVGSKIALFGTNSSKVLDLIGEIEVAEGLPHPMINGVWAKKSREATASYLILSFDSANLDQAMALTKKAGLKYLYHGDPFQTWGKFKLHPESFPNNWASLKSMVDRAKKQGIGLGVHTLSNFITTNDAYVTPVPDPRLAKVGESVLVNSISATADEIEIASPDFFNQMTNNTLHAVVVGNELIRYREVSKSAPWKLLGCIRGAYGTQATAHSNGAKIGKLMDHPYQVFLSDPDLSEEIFLNLAALFNQTGLMQTSFDGLEGVWSTGMGQYARSLYTKTWYDNLNPELKGKVINDASNPSHFNWHINTRYNWGEPWYSGFRESQTDLRLINQDFYRRNLLPSMLGWFNMTDQTSVEDTEWLLARAAGFDAGFAFNLKLANVAKNGISDQIFEKMRIWETARMAGAFTPEQKLRMEDITKEFSLTEVENCKWELVPYEVKRYVHVQKVRQPGEPLYSQFEFENPNREQSMILTISLSSESGDSKAESISIEINGFHRVELPVGLSNAQVIKLDEKGVLKIFDKNWNLLEEKSLGQKVPVLVQGKNKLVVDARFTQGEGGKLSLEVKTEGIPEQVSCPN